MAETAHDPSVSEVDVAVVGCGPTGATLANLLGQAGLKVAVIERETAPPDLPRAVHFDGEVMRIFQSLGLAEALLPLVRPSGGMQYVSAAGQLLLMRKPAAPTGHHGWASNYLFHQPDLEACLRRGLARYEQVGLYPGHEVETVTTAASGALLQVRERATGRTWDLRASHVVGCDGARSLVRQAVG
ncbi:MAG: FAD-dependent monooxygenase, partial [Rhodobacteraceae bacterium]|nr:FAD-dependent monooxygenase [Paracoccaceae bacterium]